ncbi:hypothetical protein AXF42_Ash020787 [Apostasia shenzhenica]|uniref:Uncharacterized protein n=1 Tax=Apostasia shenzhenica TaxID=1088818 RepID=A0A2I0AR45_9ASPA|nr:hypothetical protein AXF42_Ash020787 [Apostasia shenzhenica]
MGLPPPTPFYSGNWTLASLSSGINFGSTPATILSYSSPISAAAGMFLFQTLSQQVRQVYETLQFLHLEAGQAAARRVASSTLFLLSFGRDDYVSILSGTNTAAAAGRPKYGRRGLSRLLVSQMIQAVKVSRRELEIAMSRVWGDDGSWIGAGSV